MPSVQKDDEDTTEKYLNPTHPIFAQHNAKNLPSNIKNAEPRDSQ